jgi:hypothetical protein
VEVTEITVSVQDAECTGVSRELTRCTRETAEATEINYSI